MNSLNDVPVSPSEPKKPLHRSQELDLDLDLDLDMDLKLDLDVLLDLNLDVDNDLDLDLDLLGLESIIEINDLSNIEMQ